LVTSEIKAIFYNNVNSKKLKSTEELVTEIAAMHNIIRAEVIPNMVVPFYGMGTDKRGGPNFVTYTYILTTVPYLCMPVNDNFSEYDLDIKALF
jgi:hypothetical protein